ncbi:hypothetical protein C8A03DRAFT_43673 [Achaetomium macrosporum]|uniref:Uncharacterized protein n=1 Tax=Achaetomium macrosporum TaxID=79813 RepID=A0AAN7HFR7_9PEZI|nr:hypothetical protein C8A03DRAFT_43673 [Achaetomium macrosporum]
MQPYSVEDLYPDPIAPGDAWAAFLAARFSHRRELYQSFSNHEKETIRKELRRIRYLRIYFASHRLSSSDTFPVQACIEQSHNRWRERASQRCKDELHRCENAIEKASGYRWTELNRQRSILKQVEQWPTQEYDYAYHQQLVAPESLITGLYAAEDSVDDNPAESNYGYSGWVIVFSKDKGGINLNHPLCHGKFPHQKISVQRLLYDKANTPLKRSADRTHLRYFHLQANNMKWVEDAIARYYEEDNSQIASHVGLHHPSASKPQTNTERLLKRELWHGQDRGDGKPHMPPCSRQIRPRCALVPSAAWKRDASEEGLSTQGTDISSPPSKSTYIRSSDIVLFMPYLHWEIEKRLVRMTNVIRKTKQMNDQEFAFERLSKRKGTWGSVVERAKSLAKRIDSTVSDLGTWDNNIPSWKPQSPLGSYLWYAAKVFQLIDEAADWRLIDDHLCTQSPLHPRRTLEQYYYWTAEDTTHRDRQQVVYRATRMRNDPDAIPRVIMVDQLWMWILDENTILTAFPRRWARNKPDPSAVHRAIRDHLGSVDNSQIRSIYDLALIIVDECSKVFFDRTKPDLRPEVVDMFGSAISNVSEKKSEAYERFGRDVKRMNTHDPLQTAEELLRKSLNIKFEWSVLMEAQSIIDQLQIMQEIFTQQITVMSDFEKALRDLNSEGRGGLEATLDRAGALILEMKLRREELANLEKRQANTRTQLRELLDMKQQQAGIIEAKAAIRRADETVIQGRSIVVFTVVTIFFLPLSFFATLFGMNAQELNGGTMTLGAQLMWMFVISSVVICLSLAIAFSASARTAIFGAVRGALGYLERPVRTNTTAKGHLTSASPRALRDFMIAKQKEWERKDCVNDTASGALPLHQGQEGKLGRAGMIARLWKRKPA